MVCVSLMWCCCCPPFQKHIAVSVLGEEVPQAVLEYIRHNDVAVLEGCEKVSPQHRTEGRGGEGGVCVCHGCPH